MKIKEKLIEIDSISNPDKAIFVCVVLLCSAVVFGAAKFVSATFPFVAAITGILFGVLMMFLIASQANKPHSD